MAAFENMLKSGDLYTNTTKEDASIAVIWWTDVNTNESFIAQSGIVNSDGSFAQKDAFGASGTVDQNGFKNGHLPTDHYTYEIFIIREKIKKDRYLESILHYDCCKRYFLI